MEFSVIVKRAKEIKEKYAAFSEKEGYNAWGASEHTQALVGDVGDLMKLVMAKNNLRDDTAVDKKLAHELADCLWSTIIIAQELGINLEKEFFATMNELEERITRSHSSAG